MKLRNCSKEEAKAAARQYGCKDEHELKSEVMGNFMPASVFDIFIDTETKEAFVANKNGSGAQPTGVYLN